MKGFFMKNIGYLIALLDVAVYLIFSFIFIDALQVSIVTILVNGAVLYVSATICNSALTQQGLLNGHDNEKYKETLRAHLEERKKIFPKMKYLQLWLDIDYYKLLKLGRTGYINSAGYEYEDVFTEKGKLRTDFKLPKPKYDSKSLNKWWKKLFYPLILLFWWAFSDDWKLYRQQRSCIKKAKAYKVTHLTVSHLMQIEKGKDPNDFGISEKAYMSRHGVSSTITRLVLSVLIQCVTFGFLGFDLTTFLVQLLCIAGTLIGAFYSMFSAYCFVVKTHRETIKDKISKMEEFDNADMVELKKKEEEEHEIRAALSIQSKGDLVEEKLGQG